MKKIYIPFIAATALASSVALTGCIEETIPTDRVTQESIVSSPFAASASANGMPAFMNTVFVLGDNSLHYDCGYAMVMHVRDVMTGDVPVIPSGYDWFTNWELTRYQAEGNIYPQVMWNFYNQLVQTSNLTVGAVDPETTDNAQSLYYLASGYAYRAMAYLDMARMFEYLPTDGTSPITAAGNDVTGLTVPIVTESTTEEEARNNPRVTHKEMLEFILNDLDNAEKYIGNTRLSMVMPSLAVVYGLKARAYMWDEDYPKAQEFAEKAIAAHNGSPLSEAQWLDAQTGFNKANQAWMWCMTYVAEDPCVLTGIINFTSWTSNEWVQGYTCAEPHLMIDAALYNSLSNDDFRKRAFVAPSGSPLEGQENWIDKDLLEENGVYLEPYSSLKFKPGNGAIEGSSDEACTVDVPLMRIEEMHFIRCEAIAQQNPAQGKSEFEAFMQKYRYSSYTCPGSSKDEVVTEIFNQKRAEFILEGLSFFDYKRLDKPVIRHYDGTNWATDRQYNTTTRPAWMNLVIVQTEQNNNKAVVGFNNPDPSLRYPNLGEQ